jgi:hypothetical protein
VSHAAQNLVYCARREDLGCQASHPGSKWASIRAGQEGWFTSRANDLAYCPDHVPEWATRWRARRDKVASSFEKLPMTAGCAEGDYDETVPDDDPGALAALRGRAGDHVVQTGHQVTVTTTQRLTLDYQTPEAAGA